MVKCLLGGVVAETATSKSAISHLRRVKCPLGGVVAETPVHRFPHARQHGAPPTASNNQTVKAYLCFELYSPPRTHLQGGVQLRMPTQAGATQAQQLPSLCRAAIYIDENGRHLASTIVEINDPGPEDVTLFVMDPTLSEPYWARRIPFSAVMTRNTWSWPARTG